MATADRPARLTAHHWLIFAVASAGWVFDVYEGQLFVIFKTPAFADVLHLSESGPGTAGAARIGWHADLANALFLVGGALGGLAFGILGDRIGRVRTMTLTILTYSVFSALTFFATEPWHIHILRFLVALGVGGEWAVAAALVAEVFPANRRAFASGAFHASSVLGVVFAALTGRFLTAPGAWRWGFLLGLAPALLTLVIRLGVREPERPRATGPRGSLRELLGDPTWSRRAWLGLGLAAVGLSTYWGIFAWVPELVVQALGPSVPEAEARGTASLAYLMMNCSGGLLGLLAFAPISGRIGRRGAFALFHVGAVVLVPLTFLGARSSAAVLAMLPLMSFFVLGMHAGYAIYFPELFPSRLRATGSSFCFNVGRLVSGAVLVVRGSLRSALDLRQAAALMASVFLVGLVLLAFAPETRGQELPE
jgi:MFS family permease